MNRRNFLYSSTGVLLTIPFLESFGAQLQSMTPKRMVCVGTKFGLNPYSFFPKETGREFTAPTLLKAMEQHKKDYTVFSNMGHPGMSGGHRAVHTFLSGVKAEQYRSMPEGNISIDQKAAEFVGSKTRFPSLQFSPRGEMDNNLSWTRNGVAVPAASNAQNIYSLLFSQGNAKSKKELSRVYSLKKSILDTVKADAADMDRKINKDDKEKLDQYFTSVRSVEKKIKMSEQWLDKAKPKTAYELPRTMPREFAEITPIIYDLIVLALQTDSSRIITMQIADWKGSPGIDGVNNGYHYLTHHGKREDLLKELNLVEGFHMAQFSRFLTKLKEVKESNGKTLFDNTMSLIGSGMGNASSHNNKVLPLLLAGGNYKHAGHINCKPKAAEVRPACDLYLNMLQNFGLEIDRFSTGKNSFDLETYS